MAWLAPLRLAPLTPRWSGSSSRRPGGDRVLAGDLAIGRDIPFRTIPYHTVPYRIGHIITYHTVCVTCHVLGRPLSSRPFEGFW